MPHKSLSFTQYSSWLTIHGRLGYSAKGWTNSEIGVQMIKHFNEKMRAKAKGWVWLLLVDGHNLHYTWGFLAYAQNNNIIVLCYPSHSTHIYQHLTWFYFLF